MARSPTDYLSDDWGMTPPGGTNASGAGETPDGPAPNIPFNQDVPLTPEWGMLGKGRGGYGHSSDVEEVADYKSWPGIDKDDVAQGYTKPGSGGAKEPGVASFEQSIPDSNPHDRGAGSAVRDREFSEEGRGFDGTGTTRNRTGMGTSKLVG